MDGQKEEKAHFYCIQTVGKISLQLIMFAAQY